MLGTTLGLVSIVGLDAKSAISWNFKWYYDKHAIIFYDSTHSMQTDCLQGSAVQSVTAMVSPCAYPPKSNSSIDEDERVGGDNLI